jgi:hypothetical protein
MGGDASLNKSSAQSPQVAKRFLAEFPNVSRLRRPIFPGGIFCNRLCLKTFAFLFASGYGIWEAAMRGLWHPGGIRMRGDVDTG